MQSVECESLSIFAMGNVMQAHWAFAYRVFVLQIQFSIAIAIWMERQAHFVYIENLQFDLLLISIHLKCEITTVCTVYTLTLQIFWFMKSTFE